MEKRNCVDNTGHKLKKSTADNNDLQSKTSQGKRFYRLQIPEQGVIRSDGFKGNWKQNIDRAESFISKKYDLQFILVDNNVFNNVEKWVWKNSAEYRDPEIWTT